MNQLHRSHLLVIIQLLCFIGLFRKYGLFVEGRIFIVQLIAILLGVWSILQFEIKFLSIYPQLKTNAKLVKSGPYQYIRNPMYTSLVFYFGPFIVDTPSIDGSLTFIILLVVLFVKIGIEEKEIRNKFPEETEYFDRTKKLIPFIY